MLLKPDGGENGRAKDEARNAEKCNVFGSFLLHGATKKRDFPC